MMLPDSPGSLISIAPAATRGLEPRTRHRPCPPFPRPAGLCAFAPWDPWQKGCPSSIPVSLGPGDSTLAGPRSLRGFYSVGIPFELWLPSFELVALPPARLRPSASVLSPCGQLWPVSVFPPGGRRPGRPCRLHVPTCWGAFRFLHLWLPDTFDVTRCCPTFPASRVDAWISWLPLAARVSPPVPRGVFCGPLPGVEPGSPSCGGRWCRPIFGPFVLLLGGGFRPWPARCGLAAGLGHSPLPSDRYDCTRFF